MNKRELLRLNTGRVIRRYELELAFDGETMNKEIKCDGCDEVYEYYDDGRTVDCMPDGELHRGKWYCYKCLRDKEVN